MKTRIVKETHNDNTERWYVEDGKKWFWGLFWTWKRPRYYGYDCFKNVNRHWSKESTQKWIKDRNEWIANRDKMLYNCQVKSVEVVE